MASFNLGSIVVFDYLVLVIGVLAASAVQLIVKLRFNTTHGEIPFDSSITQYLWGILKDPFMWLAGSLLIFAAAAWYFALSRLPLSVMFVFAALTYPTILIGSAVFLGEAVSLIQFFGCILIVVGIVCVVVIGQTQ